VLPLLGGSWRGSFVLWSVPVLATAVLVLACTPHVPRQSGLVRVRWWPDWHSPRTWQLGCIMGGIGALYFGCNAFLPDYLHTIGRPDLLNAGLTALNTGQLPASFLIMVFGRRMVGRKTPFILAALAGLVCLGGLLVPSGPVIVAAAGLIGFSAAFGLILALALPPVLARPDDVHRMAAGMLALGYTITFVVPWLGGAVWDATHVPEAALLPGVLGALIVIAMASTFRLEPQARVAQHA
jgi:CP family cyanate transporter-like MFS transporter